MVFRSEYFNKGLLFKLIKSWKWVILVIFLISILCVSGSNNPDSIERGRTRSKRISAVVVIIDGITGLQYFGFIQLFISIVVTLLFGLFIFGYLYGEHKKLKMIVGLEIDYLKDELILFTKDLLDRKYKIVAKLSDVKLNKDLCKDRMSIKQFDCYVFIEDKRAIGRLYFNHFLWNNSEVEKIKEGLKMKSRILLK